MPNSPKSYGCHSDTANEVLILARKLILAGKPVDEVVKVTGLANADVRRAAGWLKTPAGQSWTAKIAVPPVSPSPVPVREVQRGTTVAKSTEPEKVFVRTDETGALPAPEGEDGITYALAQVQTPEGVRQVMVPVQPAGGKGRGTVNVTSITLDYYDRANADYLAEIAKTTPEGQMPLEYPGGLAGFIEDCIVKYFDVVLGKKLAWVEVRR